jgi:RNA polymerase sigma-70 factor (ECF subfamily)
MAQTNSKQNPLDLTTPLSQREDCIVGDSEYLIRQAFAVNIRQGYELLFRRYYKVLCNQAVRFTYAQDVAEDIVADVFMGFWKNQVHQHITTSYRAYLYQAVRNRVYNHLQNEFRRTSQLGKPVELDTVTQALSEDPQSILQSTELYQRLEAEIKRLPPQCQRVFVLSRFEGKKQREIAQEMQISLKAVEGHIQRALLQLRKVLQMGLIFCIIDSLLS